jgi:hydrogenase nickel incorporation protein HypA/HybF
MHELSIAGAVLDAVRAEARRHPCARLRRVGLRVGELSGVDGDALSFCFESLVHDTELASLTLEIESCRRRHRCPKCGGTFVVADYDVACPECGALQTDCIGGDELELVYLEMEEP